MLILIALPIIAFALFLLWKEYGEYYGKSPIVEFPGVPQLSAGSATSPSPANTSMNDSHSRRGWAVEEVPKARTTEQAAVVARAKSTIVSMLDSSLPRQPIADWMAGTAGESARIVWEVNDCGDGSRQPGTMPVCAQANINFSNGRKFQALLLMGTRTSKLHSVQFAAPSLLWAVYSTSDDGALTPAPLSAFTRIAQSAN